MIEYYDELPEDLQEVIHAVDDLSEALAIINDGIVSTADLERAALATLGEKITSDAINLEVVDLCVPLAADYRTREHLKGEASDNESAN